MSWFTTLIIWSCSLRSPALAVASSRLIVLVGLYFLSWCVYVFDDDDAKGKRCRLYSLMSLERYVL